MYLVFVYLAFGDVVVINYIIHFTLFLQQVEGNLIGAIPNSVYNLSLTALQLCSRIVDKAFMSAPRAFSATLEDFCGSLLLPSAPSVCQN